MPSHSHSITDPQHSHSATISDPGHIHFLGNQTSFVNGGFNAISVGAAPNYTGSLLGSGHNVTVNNASRTTGITINATGMSLPFDTYPPMLTLNFIIRYN